MEQTRDYEEGLWRPGPEEKKRQQILYWYKWHFLFRIRWCIIYCSACNNSVSICTKILHVNVFIILQWVRLVTWMQDSGCLPGHRFYSNCLHVFFFLDFCLAKTFAWILSTVWIEQASLEDCDRLRRCHQAIYCVTALGQQPTTCKYAMLVAGEGLQW